MLRTKIASAALAVALFGTVATGAVAQQRNNQGGGAAGLVAAVVNVNVNDTIDIAVVDSFNNLRALNNVLNNSPILSNIDITVGDVTLLNNFVNGLTIQEFLNNNNVDIDDVVAIGVLNGDQVIIFV